MNATLGEAMDKPAPLDHPIHELLAHRWSPRAFSDRPVDRATVRSLLEAARWAPSSMNEQPWRFVVATREDREAFDRLAACLSSGNRQWAPRAALLVAVVAAETFRRNGRPNRHAWHDVGQAIALLTVEASARGLSVHQMGGIDRESLREAIGIPDGFSPITVVAIGYPGAPEDLPEDLAERERAERKRLPQSEFAFSGAWNRPL
jgi:nitroreductase